MFWFLLLEFDLDSDINWEYFLITMACILLFYISFYSRKSDIYEEMRRIEKIDQFIKSNPTKYGLDADGCFFEVKEEFYIECIEDYKKDGEFLGVNTLKPVWTKMKALPGDILVVNKNSSYIIPKGEETYIECKPFQIIKDKGLNNLVYSKDKLIKIGKDVIKSKSMPLKDRLKITLSRPI